MANSARYDVHAIADRLAATTGRTLAQWIAVARQSGPTEARACARWLEREHELGPSQAQIVAGEACGASVLAAYDEVGELVRALYIQREAFLPLHERVVAAARAQGPDVRVSPCRSYVSLSRKKQFATIRPKKHGLEVRTRGAPSPTFVRDERDLDTLAHALAAAYARAL